MMFIFAFNTIIGEVSVVDKEEATIAWAAQALPRIIYFFGEIKEL